MSGFRRVTGKFLAKTTLPFDYRRKARPLRNKRHTARRRPNASHPNAMVWTEIPAPKRGIFSALQPINVTLNLYEHYAVT